MDGGRAGAESRYKDKGLQARESLMGLEHCQQSGKGMGQSTWELVGHIRDSGFWSKSNRKTRKGFKQRNGMM